jgi:hypothetical protein
MNYRQQWLRDEGEVDAAKRILHGRGDKQGR